MGVVMQHEHEVCVVKITDFDVTVDLGSPFKVILSNGVTQQKDDRGRVITTIPDLTGLFKSVVQSRVLHPRKLCGSDLKFVRRAVGLQAKFLAKKMDVTPEHLSRCEGGTKVLSGAPEKIFRALSFVSSFCPDPQSIIAKLEENPKLKKEHDNASNSDSVKKINNILMSLYNMDIETVYDAKDDLVFRFCLDIDEEDDFIDDDEDTVWQLETKKAKAA